MKDGKCVACRGATECPRTGNKTSCVEEKVSKKYVDAVKAIIKIKSVGCTPSNNGGAGSSNKPVLLFKEAAIP